MLEAPGRVSTTTVWPQFSVIFWPMTRAMMSVEPPGANGTIILIGLSGYLSADCAAAGAGYPAIAVTHSAATIALMSFTRLLPADALIRPGPLRMLSKLDGTFGPQCGPDGAPRQPGKRRILLRTGGA